MNRLRRFAPALAIGGTVLVVFVLVAWFMAWSGRIGSRPVSLGIHNATSPSPTDSASATASEDVTPTPSAASTSTAIAASIAPASSPNESSATGCRARPTSGSAPPPARAWASMANDGAHGVVLMFGGYAATGGTYLGDTWTWDGARWTQMHPVTSPSPRYGASMAYDLANREVILFGGYSNGVFYHDSWTWNGANWEQETPASAPSGRVDAAVAYDPFRARIVLFGGGAPGPALADTWSWNGHTWTQLHPAASPPARQGGVMTYDPPRNKLILAGSVNGAPEAWAPWALDGASWAPVQMATSATPPHLGGPFLGGFPTTGHIVLFAGVDTWIWDGSKWAFIAAPPRSPSQRDGGMQTATPMAYDACRRELVLFSGQGPSGWLTDTWTFDGATWTRRG